MRTIGKSYVTIYEPLKRWFPYIPVRDTVVKIWVYHQDTIDHTLFLRGFEPWGLVITAKSRDNYNQVHAHAHSAVVLVVTAALSILKT